VAVNYGVNKDFNATPFTGYEVNEWKVDGGGRWQQRHIYTDQYYGKSYVSVMLINLLYGYRFSGRQRLNIADLFGCRLQR